VDAEVGHWVERIRVYYKLEVLLGDQLWRQQEEQLKWLIVEATRRTIKVVNCGGNKKNN
jgi:hypothetical protein